MKFCPVVPEICRGQVHGARKERRRTRTRIIIIIRRNGAKTISLQTLFGKLNQRNLPPKLEVTNEDKVIVRFNEPWIEMVRVKYSRTSP
jgi:hypothetical protein